MVNHPNRNWTPGAAKIASKIRAALVASPDRWLNRIAADLDDPQLYRLRELIRVADGTVTPLTRAEVGI
jgi:hypothetical protein